MPTRVFAAAGRLFALREMSARRGAELECLGRVRGLPSGPVHPGGRFGLLCGVPRRVQSTGFEPDFMPAVRTGHIPGKQTSRVLLVLRGRTIHGRERCTQLHPLQGRAGHTAERESLRFVLALCQRSGCASVQHQRAVLEL